MAPYLDKVFPTPSGKFEFMTKFDGDVLKNDDENYPYTLLSVAPLITSAPSEPLQTIRHCRRYACTLLRLKKWALQTAGP